MVTLEKRMGWYKNAISKILCGVVKTTRLCVNNKHVTMYIQFDFLFIDVIVERPLFISTSMDENFEGPITSNVEMIRFRVKNNREEGALNFLLSL